jgi:thioesterase domain-containing protein
MLYIVDGTGPIFDDDYAVSMAGSHCAVLAHLNRPDSFYYRGPSPLSAIKTTGGTADRVYQKVMQEEFPSALLAPGQRQKPKSKIFLIGYSRGGAAVVRVAQMLDRFEIPVEAMFLFDAVDRTIFLPSVETVPGNVRRCFHAMRNEGAEVVMEHEAKALWNKCKQAKGFAELHKEFQTVGSGPYEQFLAHRSAALQSKWPELASAIRAWQQKSVSLSRLRMAMRNSFGLAHPTGGLPEPSVPFSNCATRFDPKCKAEVGHFACSHGAVGGTPWTNLGDEIAALDQVGAKQSWVWMSSRMIGCDIKAGKSA